MINISNFVVKPYVFLDDEKKVVTKNPSQGLYILAQNTDLSSEDKVKEMFKLMLNPEDLHYAEEVDIMIQIALVSDYFKYHQKQLDGRYPSSRTIQ